MSQNLYDGALIDRASNRSTPSLSDALDKLRIEGQVAGIGPIGPGYSLCGPAFTVRYRPVDTAGETVGDFIDDVPAGSVVAIDNQGVTNCTVWGDLMTESAASRHLAGTVIDGVSRDSIAALAAHYPIFSRGTWMRTGKDRVTVDAIGATISLGGVTVDPGDIIVGDHDGVVVIPSSRLAEVVEIAEAIDEVEDQIRAAVRSGERLDRAREANGYHVLQRATDVDAGVSESGG